MSVVAEPVALGREPDIMGEGPLYDSALQRLVWVDIFSQAVHEPRWTHDGWQIGRTWPVVESVSVAVPRVSGGLLAAAQTDFLGLDGDGNMEIVASFRPAKGLMGMRFNDAKCDRHGRLVVGWVAGDASRPASLIRLDRERNIEVLLSDCQLPNGLDWSPDAGTFYLIDTPTLGVDAFDYDISSGAITNRRTILSVEPGFGLPDGMTVDRGGCLWIAFMFAGQVRCYSPHGELWRSSRRPPR
jgi:sugar lactone lactonase YvrE